MATKFVDEKQSSVDLELIAQGVRMIIEGIGEDPERAGLVETPQRVAEMYAELTSGMREDPAHERFATPARTARTPGDASGAAPGARRCGVHR